ncbi:MAG TPA: APC family permease [Streptosporangiaceae bacterium]|nr:APC family permease [Streptosporangiaceae bacterium]
MAAESLETQTRPADVGLKREMGLIGAIWASESSIIGSGWLFGSLFAAQAAGPSALLSWVIAGIAVIILALVHAELGGMYPVSGGTARFPHFAFGGAAGISFGFFSWLQAVAVAPIECFAVMQYGSYYWKGLYNTTTGNVTTIGFVMTIVLMAVFTAINFLGIKLLSETNATIMWWKLAIPVLAIIVLFFKFHGGNFSPPGGFMPLGVKGILGAISTAGVMFAYLGFEQADQLAGEIKNPQRNLPRAIIGAVLIGVLVYVLLQVVFIGAMPTSFLGHGFAGIKNAPILAGPFAGLAGVVGLGWLAVILRIDAFISPFGTGLIYVTSTSRVSYGLGRNRYYPQIFTRTDSRGVPWFSLIIAFVFGLVFLLPFPSWHALVGLVTSASVLMYAGAPLSLGAFRRQVPEASRPYRMGGATVMAPLAFVIANLIIYWSGFEVIWKLGLCILIGYVLIAIAMAFDQNRPPLDWRSAQWLPVYLIGMGIISWMGQYAGGAVKAPLNTGRIPLWWDIVIVAVFSLAIYFWAQFVRLPRAEMLRLVEAQSGVEPPERV